MKRTSSITSAALVLGLVALFPACEGADDVLIPPVATRGLNFELEGGQTATFDTSGEPVLTQNGTPGFGAWAVARPDSVGGLVIAGFDPTDGARGNLFILQLHPRATGSFSCSFLGHEGCHGRIFTGVDPRDLSVSGASYHIVSGTVNVTELDNLHLGGTLDATLYVADGTGGLDAENQITITGGVIDVPYSNDVVLANGIACMARNLAEQKNERC